MRRCGQEPPVPHPRWCNRRPAAGSIPAARMPCRSAQPTNRPLFVLTRSTQRRVGCTSPPRWSYRSRVTQLRSPRALRRAGKVHDIDSRVVGWHTSRCRDQTGSSTEGLARATLCSPVLADPRSRICRVGRQLCPGPTEAALALLRKRSGRIDRRQETPTCWERSLCFADPLRASLS